MIERYDATVTNNGEERKDGYIKVTCVGLLGDEDSEVPHWVRPVNDWGWFYVPNVDDIVEIEVETSSDRDEVEGQFSIDNLDVQWRTKRIYGESTPIPADFTDEAYGKRRGFATPLGHIFLFDDTPDAPKVYLTWNKGTTSSDGNSTIMFDSDGTVKISIFGGKHYIHLKDNEYKLQLDDGVGVVVTDKDSDATFKLGDGAVSSAISETLETLWNNMRSTFGTHTHADAMGGTGPPNSGPMDAWDAQIKSAKMKFPNN
jgi:hypothetical protein